MATCIYLLSSIVYIYSLYYYCSTSDNMQYVCNVSYTIHASGAFFYPPLSPKRKLDDDNFFRMGSFSHFLQLRKKLEDLLFFMSGYKDFSQAEVAKVSQIYRAIFHITLQPVAINRTRSLDITTRCSSVYIYLLLQVFNLTFAFRMMSE